ncbi:MAG TPA: hypothetical protein VLM91_02655 [Candidatus Methylomirabilis sp.]|nr:hypothetical protein [Candidatus Methylomirabilis sp.]
MSETGNRASGPPGGAATGGSVTAPSGPLFVGHPHVGLFFVTKVEQTPARRESHIPGLYVVPYRVTLEAREVLPPVGQKVFVIFGAKGEGIEAGVLGLQDWLPTTVGDGCVVAFDALRAGRAEEMTYLGSGASLEYAWRDSQRFFESVTPGQGLETGRIASAITQTPYPRATFFQFVFAYDRRVYRDAAVARALGAYLASDQVPALDRRTTVAHYLGQPDPQDTETLRELAAGMLRLAVHLTAQGQAASAGVVLQRIYGFFFDPAAGTPRINLPAVEEGQRNVLLQLIDSPEAGLSVPVHRGLHAWVSGG